MVVATIATVMGLTLCFYRRDESSKRDWRADSGRPKTLFRTNASEVLQRHNSVSEPLLDDFKNLKLQRRMSEN